MCEYQYQYKSGVQLGKIRLYLIFTKLVADPRLARRPPPPLPPPIRPKMFSISCHFREIGQNCMLAPRRVGAPPTRNPGSAPAKWLFKCLSGRLLCTLDTSTCLSRVSNEMWQQMMC